MAVGATRLTDKVALVTGCTGGLGGEIVRRLAAEGAQVVLTDLPGSPLADLHDELEASDRHVTAMLDVADEQQWRDRIAEVEERFGRLDVLVNNGAMGSLATVVEEELERFKRVVDIDQVGTWLGMKHAGALMERTGGGTIVNLCSVLGTVGGFGSSIAYAAAKGAVRTMTKNAALHWARSGVRVNSVHPSFIGTDVLIDRYGGTERHAEMIAGTPMGRLGRAEDVAAAVAFLAGDDAAFITGTELYVDGWWTAA